MRTNDPAKGSPKTPSIVYVVFSLLALFSILGLDYLHFQKGEKSYLFSIFIKREETKKPEFSLMQVVLGRLSSQGIPSDSISRFKDQAGIDHLKVDISLPEYGEIESRLRQDLEIAQAVIAKKEEQEDGERKYYLWDVTREEAEKLAILFSCKKDVEKTAERSTGQEPPNKVALIMDDMGYSLDAIYDILSLEEPITIAILPFGPLSERTAQLAHQNNLEILLHLPLESFNNTEANNGFEGMIDTTMNEQEIIAAVDKDLDQVPFISGVNNHMGSKVTPNEAIMNTILGRLKQRNLFFVDSRTTGNTVAYDLALRLDVPTAQRNVFLDNERDENAIRDKLFELFALAQRNGEAIGICHPQPETLKVLKNYFHLVRQFGVKPVFVSELVR